jgi:hypothetical protein
MLALSLGAPLQRDIDKAAFRAFIRLLHSLSPRNSRRISTRLGERTAGPDGKFYRTASAYFEDLLAADQETRAKSKRAPP